MIFDQSRNMYPHWTCGTLPCSCPPRHYEPLQLELFPCDAPDCTYIGYTLNQRQEHHLDRHASQPQLLSFNGQPPS
jgi:hypothetical protein